MKKYAVRSTVALALLSGGVAAAPGQSGGAAAPAKPAIVKKSQEMDRVEERTREKADSGKGDMERVEAQARDREMEAQGGGKDTAAQMQERNQEKKAIQKEYQDQRQDGGEKINGKKPWWKFWASDD